MTSQSGGGGGAGSPVTTPGDLIVGNGAGSAARLGKGADNTALIVDLASHLPAWEPLTVAMLPTLDKARYKSGTAQNLPFQAPTIINFDTKDYDTNNCVGVGAAWKFTAKVAGQYRVSATILIESTPYVVGNSDVLSLYKNGSAYSTLYRIELQVAGTYRVGLIGDDTVTLAVSDFIDVRATINLNSGSAVLFNNNQFNFVSIELVL